MPLLKNSDGSVILYAAKQGAAPSVDEVNQRLASSESAGAIRLASGERTGEIRKYVVRLYELEPLFAEARALGMKMEGPVPGFAGSQPESTLMYLPSKHGLWPGGRPSHTIIEIGNPKPLEHTPLFKSVPGGLYVMAIDVYDEVARATVKLPDDGLWVKVDRDSIEQTRRAGSAPEVQAPAAPMPAKPVSAAGPGEKTIEFACPSCNAKLRTKSSLGGKRVRCPKCNGAVAVPQVQPHSPKVVDGPPAKKSFLAANLLHRIQIPFEKKEPNVDAVAISADGRLAVSAHFDRVVRCWETETGKLKHTLAGHESGVVAVAMTPDGKYAISACGSAGAIRLWDLSTGSCVRVFETQNNCRIDSVSLSADGKFAISNRDANDPMGEKPLLLWDVSTGRLIRTFETAVLGMVSRTAISPDGRLAMSCGQDQIVRLWDVNTGKPAAELKGHSAWIYSIGFSSDGKRIISGAEDNKVKIWDLPTKQCVATLDDAGCVMWVALNADGTVALSRSSDNTTRIWDVAANKCLATLTGHSNRVAASLSSNARIAVSGSYDNTIQIWELVWSSR